MLKSLKNRRNRKGFTLAELLIVVAIIAVLVAIAVPLFVGEINRAREATFEANQRAARGAVIAALLKDGGEKLTETETFYTVKVNTKTGEIGDITKEGSAATTDYEAWQATGKSNPEDGKIIIGIKKTDLTITGAGG